VAQSHRPAWAAIVTVIEGGKGRLGKDDPEMAADRAGLACAPIRPCYRGKSAAAEVAWNSWGHRGWQTKDWPCFKVPHPAELRRRKFQYESLNLEVPESRRTKTASRVDARHADRQIAASLRSACGRAAMQFYPMLRAITRPESSGRRCSVLPAKQENRSISLGPPNRPELAQLV